MSEFPKVIHVDLIKSKLPRKQPWRWVAKSEGNSRKLAVSGEFYTNKADAIDAVVLLFSETATVLLRQAEHGNTVIRQGYGE